ncbi:MAG: UDP-glucose 4-epimerase GalE [Clostridiales bacterium]|jgi:UDP-glucose 4-epimerase|nr:UDP-glucose 4-epimerase GalE [Clostridiales bacterium]
MSVLVTGGAGYIGSHTCVELIGAGYDVVIADNFSNSSPEAIRRVGEITGKNLKYYDCDIRDAEHLGKIFAENKISSVIHFAGLKAVGESVQKPLEYYDNNIGGTIVLLEAMKNAGCKKLVFSSSATVYGDGNASPLKEDMPTGETTNPYGSTKLYIERILQDIHVSDSEWGITILRYFNPIGAHKSGLIGENPRDIPNNLMPYISQVAVGRLCRLNVFGDDYDTRDGTGVRDYIHVSDLADGHVKALKKTLAENGVRIYNLGTGKGVSVLELIRAFEKASGKKIDYKIAPRRDGDVVVCYADADKAMLELGWRAKRDILEMCEDTWRWQKNNPEGF